MTCATLHTKDILEMLSLVPAESISAVISDPPYALAFMGANWDATDIIFQRRLWEEHLRVLRPGAPLRVFGSPKTFQGVVGAIAQAGFVVDGIRAWTYAHNMPKGLNISKAFDRRAGATRPVVGHKRGITGENLNDIVRGSTIRDMAEEGAKGMGAYGVGAKQKGAMIPITEAVTAEAKEWAGWGTCLKQAWQPIIYAHKPGPGSHVGAASSMITMSRVPFTGSLADNLIQFKCGALHIDRGRIPGGDQYFDKCGSVVGLPSNVLGHCYGEWASPRAMSWSPYGRWPANLIFHHGPSCQRAHDDLEQWYCSCPVHASASSKAWTAFFKHVQSREELVAYLKAMIEVEGVPVFTGHMGQDFGGAVLGDWEAILSSLRPGSHVFGEGLQALAMENAGLEIRDTLYVLKDMRDCEYVPRASSAERAEIAKYGEVPEDPSEIDHPTLKPLALMSKLLEDVDGPVLDGFMGSGTTGVAAALAGLDFIGSDLRGECVRMAELRIRGKVQEALGCDVEVYSPTEI